MTTAKGVRFTYRSVNFRIQVVAYIFDLTNPASPVLLREKIWGTYGVKSRARWGVIAATAWYRAKGYEVSL